MHLSDETLEVLAGLITGESGITPGKDGPELANFFDNRAEWEPFGAGFPPKGEYVRERLGVFNGSPRLKKFVERAFEAEEDGVLWPDNAAVHFAPVLARDGYGLRKVRRAPIPYGATVIPAKDVYEVVRLETPPPRRVPHSS
ncbi:hypothetical protein RXV86_03005 [Alisedimentitalea sp. MJ-SS2]|uniref:hypothetical protein n=1 Tax=Aliisedimentitalea sp. MJ-SS2 TaxID=3049795 RepID=UPI002910719C|nr:hypothetical protein [Alisedimentitalea sp. MJ-SS2]MDU8926344.1 hypothetical protein [Alisedimentitalea sp. MJ-SS2]